MGEPGRKGVKVNKYNFMFCSLLNTALLYWSHCILPCRVIQALLVPQETLDLLAPVTTPVLVWESR